MTIKIFNTQKRQKEDFVPLKANHVGMYVCGPTTYNFIHLGNARPIVVFDTVRRYFKYRGFSVNYIQNFTDVDDKIINRAAEEGSNAAAVAEKYIAAYYEDVAKLNVLKADVHPKVTEHIAEIIALVEKIIANGFAYEADGDVYFAVAKFPQYGQLSGRNLEEMQAGARVGVSESKAHPLDFALWKKAKPGEPAWPSPWGLGRPGWHIECSAMSSKYLGSEFDIHGGGADLVFPHHENEAAQSMAADGGRFAHYWMHNGFITVNQEKMSKSLGNFFLLRDILSKFPGPVVRFYLLSTQYRSPIDFDDEKMQVATKSLERIHNAYRLLADAVQNGGGKDSAKSGQLAAATAKAKADFIAAMDDDFNTALAIAVIFDFCREVNSLLEAELPALQAALELFNDLDAVLGMIKPLSQEQQGLAEDLMQVIINVRAQAKAQKDWATADAIRDQLKALGIILEDTPNGVKWKKSLT